jgi:hypothetical protein
MTPANLTEIEESLKRITQGEWSVHPDVCHYDSLTSIRAGEISVAESSGKNLEQAESNAHFIANAPAYVSTLVKVVRDRNQLLERISDWMIRNDYECGPEGGQIYDKIEALTENERKGE